jgi:hypothetical protein
MSVNSLVSNLVAQQPLGTDGLIFSGYSTTGSYQYNNSLPAGSYMFYASNASTTPITYGVLAKNSGTTTNIQTNLPGPVNLTSSETSLSITQLDTFTSRSSAVGNNIIQSITYGNGVYIAVASNGTVVTSSDSITWTIRNAGTNSALQVVKYLNNLFLVGGGNGSVTLFSTSTDGITWTTRNVGLPGTQINDISYGNGVYVLAPASTGTVRTSTDTVTWTSRVSASNFNTISLAFGDNIFVAGNANFMSTSTDGITWTTRLSAPSNAFVAYANGEFVAIGAAVSTSTDGITWTTRALLSNVTAGIAYSNGIYLAGYSGGIYTSTNTITWTTRQRAGFGTTGLKCVGTGNGAFLVAGNAGRLEDTIVPSTFALYKTAGNGILN